MAFDRFEIMKKSENPFEAIQREEETEHTTECLESPYKKLVNSCGSTILTVVTLLALLFITCLGILYFVYVSWPIMRDF